MASAVTSKTWSIFAASCLRKREQEVARSVHDPVGPKAPDDVQDREVEHHPRPGILQHPPVRLELLLYFFLACVIGGG